MTTEPCHSHDTYRGKFHPRCNCYPCWEKFFQTNAMKMYTVALALQKHGAAAVIKVQGTKYVKALKLFLANEEAKGRKII